MADTLTRPLTERFNRALALACDLHRLQVRKGTEIPYVAHLLGVTAIALEHGANEDEACAAVLHDAAEDQGGAPMLTRIRREFGDVVADIVDGCTDSYAVGEKPPWRQRKEDYVAHLPQKNAATRLVSASDKLNNARAILADYRELGEALWPRFSGGRDGTLWYYRALVAAYSSSGRNRLVEELDRTVTEIEALAAGRRQP